MATYLFSGHGAQGNWSDPQNWGTGSREPGAADNAIIMTGTSLTMNSTTTLGNVMLLGDSNVTFYGALTALAGVGCAGFMVCDDASASFMPGSSLNVPNGALIAGNDGEGTFLARGTTADPTVIHTNNATIGKEAIADGTVTIDHATWTVDTNVLTGYLGQGTLNVINGGQVDIGRNIAFGDTAGASGTLNLSTGGTLSTGLSVMLAGGLNATTGSATVTVGAGSLLNVGDVLRLYNGATLNLDGGTVTVASGGDLQVNAGGEIVGYGVINIPTENGYGELVAQGGSLTVTGNIVGAAVQIDAGSTINITARDIYRGSIAFQGAGATLHLIQAADVTSPITGFAAGDQIEMAGVTAANWSAATDTLKLTGAGGKVVDTLHLQGSYGSDTFTVSQQGGLGVISLHS